MPRRAFRVAYDGRPYHGFQRQPDVPTVEDELFDALRRLDVLDGEQGDRRGGEQRGGQGSEKPPGYAAAGRTDAGVSARAQTVAFDAPEWLTPHALAGELPSTIRPWAHADAPPEFHATRDADYREYRYFWFAPDVDAERVARPDFVDRAERALDRLAGEHDFHNLTPDDEHTVRDLDTGLARDGDFLVVTVRASGFCRELVRRLVSLVRDVAATGGFERVDRILGDEPVDGPAGVQPADPRPLVLHDVAYDLDFEVDPEAAAGAREQFRALHADWRAGARVATHLADF